jgi:hypothetical protein
MTLQAKIATSARLWRRVVDTLNPVLAGPAGQDRLTEAKFQGSSQRWSKSQFFLSLYRIALSIVFPRMSKPSPAIFLWKSAMFRNGAKLWELHTLPFID